MKLDQITEIDRINDITGMSFGKLLVTGIAGKRTYKNGMALYFICRCECGNEVTMQRSNLMFGKRRCCGCTREQKYTRPDGAWNHPLYKTWRHMIDRCENAKNKSFHDYGGRGIKVCELWRTGDKTSTGFECFVSDMGEKHSQDMMIDRIDNSRGYSPGNCQWADRTRQNSNKRSNILVTIGNNTRTVAEWARFKGVNEFTIYQRIRAGMDPVEAVTKPVRPCKHA